MDLFKHEAFSDLNGIFRGMLEENDFRDLNIVFPSVFGYAKNGLGLSIYSF